MINSFSDRYLPLSKSKKHSLHVSIIFLMLFSVFEETMTAKMVLFAVSNILVVYFLGNKASLQNNYIVHLVTICYQPFIMTATLKYNIFS